MVLVLLSWGLVETERAQQNTCDPEPVPVRAVAPPFIPFSFGQTDLATARIQVEVDPSGGVISARFLDSTLRDASMLRTAKKWTFKPCQTPVSRTSIIRFTYRIMPNGTSDEELTTILLNSNEVEVRHQIFPIRRTDAPIPNPPPKKTSVTPAILRFSLGLLQFIVFLGQLPWHASHDSNSKAVCITLSRVATTGWMSFIRLKTTLSCSRYSRGKRNAQTSSSTHIV